MSRQRGSAASLLHNALQQAGKGQLQPALISLEAAVRLSPNDAVLHHNRGLLLRQLGQGPAASRALHRAHQLQPSWLEPVLALTEQALEAPVAPAEHRAALEQALSQPAWSNNSRALYLRGRLAEHNADLAAAEQHYQAALEQTPPLLLAQQQLACLLLAQERWSEAQEQLERLLSQQPNRADLLSNLAIALLRQNKLRQALPVAERALAAVQGDEARASVLVNLGSILQELGERERARQSYQEALDLDPCQANALLNLGVLDLQQRDLDGAEWHYRQALLLRPGDPRTEVNLAGVLLLQGRTQEGWQHYEARLGGSSELLQRPEGLPLWQGQPLSGDLLLVHEQGLGDTFQFIRYAQLLKQLGVRCQFQGPAKLHSLLLRSGLVSQCIQDGESPPSDAEAWIPMLSLPRLLTTKPTNQPYLTADPRLVKGWHQQLGPAPGLRIALHWQGQPDHEFTVSRGRSFPLNTLAPLLSLADVEWVSLQKGPGSEQAQQEPFANHWHPQQPRIDAAWDFEDAAAILSCCDGLVTSDSGLAHLAGALGCRVWLLLPWLAEWRWGLEGSSTPWYAHHTLLRQQQEGDWSDPVDQLCNELNTLTQG
ncbi:MAG: tetratricopeptide repeat protein [Vulcanococcus sp.]|uniref:tetratricopeptide repeat protein n=1 Tax=Vulcanococcus sp. TaxID=2856995 RepID=UPI0025F76DEC|nr:tetratricopeptide repeat protein [Vulcanococcus sp.]MBW0167210.1 tetratricopeptide repeat protein [Vulcanococcus sp.]